MQQNILSLKEGTSLNRFNEKSKFQKSSKKVLFSKKYFTPKKYFRYVVVCGVLFICVFLYYEYVKEPGGNYRNIRVAESIGTIDISRKGVWSIWRTSFEDIEDALADKKSTKVNHPKITIIKLKDGRYHLFEFGDSEGAVKSKLTKRSKAHKPWEYSKIIYIDLNKCTIVKSIQENCFVCNQFE